MARVSNTGTKLLVVLSNSEVPMSPKQIQEEVGMPVRATRYALRRLLVQGLVRKVPCLDDMRTSYYAAIAESQQ